MALSSRAAKTLLDVTEMKLAATGRPHGSHVFPKFEDRNIPSPPVETYAMPYPLNVNDVIIDDARIPGSIFHTVPLSVDFHTLPDAEPANSVPSRFWPNVTMRSPSITVSCQINPKFVECRTRVGIATK